MKRYTWLVVAVLIVGAAVGVVAYRAGRSAPQTQPVAQEQADQARQRRAELKENERLRELSARRLELEMYDKQIAAGIQPKGEMPHLSPSDWAELEELERRAASRAVDRLAD